MSVKSKRHCISRQGLSEIFKTQFVISGENEIVKGNVKRVKADWPAARTCTEKREKKNLNFPTWPNSQNKNLKTHFQG